MCLEGVPGAMPTSLSVFLNVSDIERSLAWYRGLGFKPSHLTADGEGRVLYADLSFKGAEIGLGHIPANDDPEFRQWVGTPLGAGVLIYFTTTNVDALYEKAKKLKATVEVKPETRSYGRVLTLNDPDGYCIVFIDETKKKKPATKKAAAKKTAAKKTPAKKAPAKKTAAKKAAAKRAQ